MIRNRYPTLINKKSWLPDKNKFIAYWNLDEASGNALDSGPNALHLNDTGSVGAAEGGRDFELDTPTYFVRPIDDAILKLSADSFTLGIWAKLESQGATQTFMGKNRAGTGNKRHYWLNYDQGGDRYRFSVGASSTWTNVDADVYGAVPATTWAFIVAKYDRDNKQIGICVDAGAWNLAARTTAIGTSATDPFVLGGVNSAGNIIYCLDGIAKCAFIYDGLITDAQIKGLYNNGTPVKYQEL